MLEQTNITINIIESASNIICLLTRQRVYNEAVTYILCIKPIPAAMKNKWLYSITLNSKLVISVPKIYDNGANISEISSVFVALFLYTYLLVKGGIEGMTMPYPIEDIMRSIINATKFLAKNPNNKLHNAIKKFDAINIIWIP